MEIIPAVDLMKGKVVRLLGGDPTTSTSYEHLGDPIELVRRWGSEGANIIHIIDLDAALEIGNNLPLIEEILERTIIPIQIGGGIRSINKARRLLNLGVERIILSSIAFQKPSIVERLLHEFGSNRIVIALDNLNGIVMIKGWKTSTKITIEDAIPQFSNIGVNLFLITSITRDGTQSGPDLNILERIVERDIDIIVAGGIGCLKDLLALKNLGVHGVVVGKALYENSFTLPEALSLLKR